MNSNQKILFDCKKATLLIEKELQALLPAREATELKLHLTGCSVCRLYQSQTTVISTMIEQILKQHKMSGLDQEFKNGLQEQIDFLQRK